MIRDYSSDVYTHTLCTSWQNRKCILGFFFRLFDCGFDFHLNDCVFIVVTTTLCMPLCLLILVSAYLFSTLLTQNFDDLFRSLVYFVCCYCLVCVFDRDFTIEFHERFFFFSLSFFGRNGGEKINIKQVFFCYKYTERLFCVFDSIVSWLYKQNLFFSIKHTKKRLEHV